MEENGWDNRLVEQVNAGGQLVRINIFPKDRKRCLTRQATIELLTQLDTPYQIGPSGYPLVLRRDADSFDSHYYRIVVVS